MDTAILMTFLQESLFMVVVLGGFLFYAIIQGRQAITNLILGLYFALLFSIEFPYYEILLGGASSERTQSLLMVGVFTFFALIATILFARLMPREYSEKKFESLWQKILLSVGATVLVMSFSYHALPITEFITPGSPIQYLFGSEESFFMWLTAPILILFFT